MQKRAKSGVVKPCYPPTILLTNMEPKTTKLALADPTWLAAMKIEFDALIRNNTWTLVALPV